MLKPGVMRVLHVSHQYHPAIGGSERYITDLSEELARRGHIVDVYTTGSTDYHTWRTVLPPTARINNVTVWRFRSLVRGKLAWRLLEFAMHNYDFARCRPRWLEPMIFYGNGPCSPALFSAVLRMAHQYDLVHINQLHYAHAYTAFVAARLRKAPIVTTPHLHAEQPQTYATDYMHQVLAQSDTVFAVTRAEQQFILEQRLSGQVVLGGNGLSLARFPPRSTAEARQRLGLPEQAFVILFLGRKTEYKGLDITLRAFAALRQRCNDLCLMAVGPETEFSRRLWEEYGALDGVVRHGAVSEETRLDALAACDVLVLPSTGEAFGIVFLEAWAYGKAVIGPRIPSVSSLIDDEMDGYLVAPTQPYELQQRLGMLLENPTLAQTLGERGQFKLRTRYTIQQIGNIVEATYARVIRRVATSNDEGKDKG
jgi:glycosyltransferase involved in cell wall biosynthesis